MNQKTWHDQSRTGVPQESLSKLGEDFPQDCAPVANVGTPGSCNDDAIVRSIITDAIRRSSKSREVIADEMAALTGDRITVRMLNSYTSTAAELHRFPAQYLRAFCHSTGDWRLLQCICERAGFALIRGAETDLLELGRQFLKQKRAADEMETLKKRLEGIDL